jgi:hypothetical protein
MGMYNLIEDNVNKFYDVAMEKIGECESFAEFVDKMKEQNGQNIYKKVLTDNIMMLL